MSRSAISSDDLLVQLVFKAQLTVHPAWLSNSQTKLLLHYGVVWLHSGAIAQSETSCIAYKLTGFVVIARFIHIISGQIVGERGGTAFPFRFWRGNAVPLAYTTAVDGRGGTPRSPASTPSSATV